MFAMRFTDNNSYIIEKSDISGILTTKRFRSLLLLPFFLASPQVQNLSKSNGKTMHILASLGGQRSESSRASDVVHESVDCDTNARGESHTPVLASQMSLHLSDSVHVRLGESNCRLFVNGLQAHTSENIAPSHTLDGQTLSESSDCVRPSKVAVSTVNFDRQSTNPPVAKALPPGLDWLFGPKRATEYHPVWLRAELSKEVPLEVVYDRVLSRLTQLEAHEVDPHLKSDYRQAFICLSFAFKGNTEPFLASSYQMYGLHPDKVFPKIVSNRRERLGREFGQWWTSEGVLLPDVEVPKKPQVSTVMQENAAATALAAGAVGPSGHASPTTAAHKGPGNAVAHGLSQSSNLAGDATGDGTSSELPGSTSPASLPMKGRTA